MRPSPLFVALLLLGAAVHAEGPAKDPKSGPSADLVKTACTSGLLVRRADAADKDDDAAPDDAYEADAEGTFGGLFGSSDEADGKKGKKHPKKKPAKKPKTRLLRPRSAKDKAACPASVEKFYREYGDRVTAVPAPKDLPSEEIEANIDRVFGLAAGPEKKETLAALKDGDMDKKAAIVARLFDGVKKLDDASFELVAKNVQTMAAAKSGGVLAGDFGAAPDDAAAAAAAAEKAAAASPKAAPEPPLDAKSDNSPLSAEQRARFAQLSAPPVPGAPVGYAPPPVGTSSPAGPPADSYYNRYVPDFVKDAATTAGGWAADKVYGGGNPAVNVMLPADTQAPPRWREVRYGRYGTEAMIKGLVAVGADMGKLHSPTLQIGDISQKGGGTFRRHLSHKIGKDVDIFFITDKRGRFDVPWNLMLAATAVKDMNVTRIFVDTPLKSMMTKYLAAHPEIPGDERAMMAKALSHMSYWPGHDTHFHVRIDY